MNSISEELSLINEHIKGLNKCFSLILSDMYSVGNLLRCKVINYDVEKKKLFLTIQPEEVNYILKFEDLKVDMVNK